MSVPISETADLSKPRGGTPLPIARWLTFVAALVFAMVVIGGITRLTESGLSITEWKPVAGALPPLSHEAWASEFAKYRQIPEYTQINGPAGMTLHDFKFIYFWEWTHRLVGRLVGFAFALPLLWFWVKKRIPAGYKFRLVILLALGGMQGVIGWWMVVSGLTARTDVSHFRLAAHLLTALLIIGALVWTALDLRRLARGPSVPARLTGFGVVTLAVLFVELLLGAFMAGLNAGYVSNTWPLMYKHFFPPMVDWSPGIVDTLLNNPFMIHFMHRWWAWAVVTVLILLARRVRKIDRLASLAIHTAFGFQIVLGIATIMTRVNITLAVLHQAMGTLVVIATVWGLHILGSRAANRET
jgi:cytochrome c oxidase assembly protein subunit 15